MGYCDGKKFQFCNVLIKKKQSGLENIFTKVQTFFSDTLGDKITIFRGICLICELKTEVNSKIFIISKNFDEISYLFSLKNSANRQMTGDAAFDELFCIYCGDENLVRRALGPNLRRKLVNLRKKFGEKITIVFRERRFFIYVERDKLGFLPSIERTKSQNYAAISSEIMSFISVVTELNLAENSVNLGE